MSNEFFSWLKSCSKQELTDVMDEAMSQMPGDAYAEIYSGGPAVLTGRLAEAAEELEKTRWATLICDSAWRLVWVSEEMKYLLGETDELKLGYGRHIYEAWTSSAWYNATTGESQIDAFLVHVPFILHDTIGGKETLQKIFGPGFAVILDAVEPTPPPPVWMSSIEFVRADLPPARVNSVSIRMADEKGNLIGTAFVYGSNLPARVLDLVARGDAGMYERSTRLFNPGRRQAAVLFADLQESFKLSRHMPSAAFFKLLASVTTAIDQTVVDHQGIVGKHAGDGVTAFFLSEDLGSPSRAARAAIEAAREIGACVREAATNIADEIGVIDTDEVRVNVGVHWGGRLYMGQLVTGGRLEVTALGDAMNECARIQESARDGATFASKSLIEHLEDDDARVLDLDPDSLLYTTVAELPGAPEKAVRDAGGIPVTAL
jgi:class 3 adenylate cyclase